MQLCNRADEDTDKLTAQLVEAAGSDSSHLRQGKVVAGASADDGREMLVSVPGNFSFSMSAFDTLCDAPRSRGR